MSNQSKAETQGKSAGKEVMSFFRDMVGEIVYQIGAFVLIMAAAVVAVAMYFNVTLVTAAMIVGAFAFAIFLLYTFLRESLF
jgi:predicted membrane channel-forming protein YqfA (hemolysin III family)